MWAAIFLELKPYWTQVAYWYRSPASFWASEEVLKYRQYRELRLVCRKFRQICDTRPKLMQCFVFCGADASLFTTRLLLWLRAGRKVSSLHCFSNQSCLGMLLPTQLMHLSLSVANSTSISCLSAYTSLVCCQLHQPSESALSLQPLAALRNLEELILEDAEFSDIPTGAKLTYLFLSHANVTCKPESTILPSLLHLTLVSNSSLEVPGVGASAETALTRLELQHSIIKAETQHDWYLEGRHPPESMSQMVSLTNLTVAVDGSHQLSLQPFTILPALTRLHLMHTHASSIAGDVAGLSRLTKLVISSGPHLSGDADQSCPAIYLILTGGS